MGKCSLCNILFHVLSACQVILAILIAVLVAVKLVDVSMDGLDYNYTCLLGTDYGSSSLCTYTFVVVGVSLAVSAAVSLLQCCTCNLCGLGKILDILLAAFGTAWWAVASGVIGANATDSLPPIAQPELSPMADLLALLRLALGEVAHGRLPPPDVLKPLISKGLGYGILAGSTLVKVPQVANVLRAKSAAGLSPLSFELETLGLVIAVTYGFLMRLPFSAFGETVALLLQNGLLLFLIYYYQRRPLARAATAGALLAGAGAVALSGQLSAAHISTLYDFNNVILVASRLPQIWQNQRSKSTGQLSIITYALNTAGAAARIFTSIQEKAGAAMLRGAMLSTLLNGILALQIVLYGNAAAKKKGRGKRKAA